MPEAAPSTGKVIPIDAATAEKMKPQKPLGKMFPDKFDPPKPWTYPAERPIFDGAEFSNDYTENFIPKSGFLRDFCEARMGYETSPFFLLWAGLFTLGASTRRQVGLKWGESKLYPNLYVFFCAPPGTVKKTVPIDLARDVLSGMEAYSSKERKDSLEAFLQSPNVLSGKGTPESFMQLLTPRARQFLGNPAFGERDIFDYSLGSQADIIVSELTTFLNTSSYNEVLVDRLTDLWDCREAETTEITVGRGKESIREVFVNLLAGTAPDSLRDSLPEKAWGGGFVSRLCLVFEPVPTRCVPTPYVPEGYPVIADLRERLYWCVKNAKNWGPEGEFTLASDAREAYITFYKAMHASIIENQHANHHTQNRLTQLVLKVAMLVRMSRYEEGTVISLEDFNLAKKIMLYTQNNAKFATEANGDAKFIRVLDTIKLALLRAIGQRVANGEEVEDARKAGVTRHNILRTLTRRGFYATDFDSAIMQMTYSGLALVDGKADGNVKNDGKQTYSLAELTESEIEEALSARR